MGHIWPQFIVVSILAAFLPSPLLKRVNRNGGFAGMRTGCPYRCTGGKMLERPHNTTLIALAGREGRTPVASCQKWASIPGNVSRETAWTQDVVASRALSSAVRAEGNSSDGATAPGGPPRSVPLKTPPISITIPAT